MSTLSAATLTLPPPGNRIAELSLPQCEPFELLQPAITAAAGCQVEGLGIAVHQAFTDDTVVWRIVTEDLPWYTGRQVIIAGLVMEAAGVQGDTLLRFNGLGLRLSHFAGSTWVIMVNLEPGLRQRVHGLLARFNPSTTVRVETSHYGLALTSYRSSWKSPAAFVDTMLSRLCAALDQVGPSRTPTS